MRSTWYKRRLPLASPVPRSAPVVSAGAPRPVVCSSVRRPSRGVVLGGRVPRATPAPVAGKALLPRVVRRDGYHAGLVVRSSPPLKAPPPPVAGKCPGSRVETGAVPVGLRGGRVVVGRLPGPAWQPDRTLVLRAESVTSLVKRVSGKTAWPLRADGNTALKPWASEIMSIASNFSFFQGEDLLFTFSLLPPQDITGWTLTGTVRDKLGGTSQFTVTPTITDAGRGIFTVAWTRSNTSGLSPGDYVWDVRRTDAGKNTVLAHGEATCKQAVTS